MFFYSKAGFNKYIWLIITVIVGILVFSAWHSMMNFIFLIFYVNIGITLILLLDPLNLKEQLINFSRLIIGFVFLLAASQKILSHHFIYGSFFYHEWFNNPIFATFLYSIGYHTQLTINYEHWHQMILGFASNTSTFELILPSNPSLRILAKIMAVLTIFIESMIAILFLLPSKIALSKFRDYFFLMFLIGAYFIVPMFGYGILFVALGFYQSIRTKYLPSLYLGIGIIVLIFSVIRTIQVIEQSTHIYQLPN
jgi:hypothetical protein